MVIMNILWFFLVISNVEAMEGDWHVPAKAVTQKNPYNSQIERMLIEALEEAKKLSFKIQSLYEQAENQEKPILFKAIKDDIQQVTIANTLRLFAQSSHMKERYLNETYKSCTPLIYVCRRKKWELAEFFIKHGACVHTKDYAHGNTTPLHYAVQALQLKMVKLLINHHADVNVQDDMGITALLLLIDDPLLLNSKLTCKEIILELIKARATITEDQMKSLIEYADDKKFEQEIKIAVTKALQSKDTLNPT